MHSNVIFSGFSPLYSSISSLSVNFSERLLLIRSKKQVVLIISESAFNILLPIFPIFLFFFFFENPIKFPSIHTEKCKERTKSFSPEFFFQIPPDTYIQNALAPSGRRRGERRTMPRRNYERKPRNRATTRGGREALARG